ERVDEEAFLTDLHRTMDEVRASTLHELERPDWDLFVSAFTQTDRVAHMFYRLLDPTHPRYDPVLAARYGDAVLRVYERMDAIIGEVPERPGGKRDRGSRSGLRRAARRDRARPGGRGRPRDRRPHRAEGLQGPRHLPGRAARAPARPAGRLPRGLPDLVAYAARRHPGGA